MVAGGACHDDEGLARSKKSVTTVCSEGLRKCWGDGFGALIRRRGLEDGVARSGLLASLFGAHKRRRSLPGPTTESEFRRRIEFVGHVPLFKRLPRAQFPLLARVLRAHQWQPGEVVLLQGQVLTQFSLIFEGWAEVEANSEDRSPEVWFKGCGNMAERLQPGDYFGERLLQQGSAGRSPARVVAGPEGLVTLSMTAAEFDELGLRKHLIIPRRQSVGRCGTKADGHHTCSGRPVGHPRAEAEAQRRFIADAIRHNANLRSLVCLKEEVIQQMCDAAYRQEVEAGTEVVHRGEYGGLFYIVESGSFELRLDDVGAGAGGGAGGVGGDGKGVDDEGVPNVTRVTSGLSAGLAAASEMRRRQGRKERFLQTLIHSKELQHAIFEEGDDDEAVDGSDTSSGVFKLPGAAIQPQKEEMEAEGFGGRSLSKRSFAGHSWRCNSWSPEEGSASPPTLGSGVFGRNFGVCIRSQSMDAEEPRDPAATPQVDPSMQGLKPALVSPLFCRVGSMGGRQRRCFGRTQTAGLPNLLAREDQEKNAFHSSTTPREGVSRRTLSSLGSSVFGEPLDATSSMRQGTPANQCEGLRNGVLGIRKHGDSFGEVALLYHAPRTSTAAAREDSVVWCVSQNAFRKILSRGQRDRAERIVRYLDQVDLLQGLLSHEKLELAQNFLKETFKPGDWIVREGEIQNVWYIIVEGECEIVRGAGEQEEVLATLSPPEYFGERAMLRDLPSEFSVRVSSSGQAQLLLLDGPTFKELTGLMRNDAAFRHAIEDDLVEFAEYKSSHHPKLVGLVPRLHKARDTSSAAAQSPESDLEPQQQRPLRLDPDAAGSLRALDRICVLGTGGFGVVTLEQDPMTGQRFALKTVSKGLIKQNRLQESIRSEREILTMIDSPFCIRLHETFKDHNYLYFLFEPLLGGDLHGRMHREPDVFGRPVVFRFIIGCIICALSHLHERHVVFRDLKPENVLLDSSGYAKLCDYGFAKFVLGRTMTLCGTPEYMAPEAIRNIGYTRMVDWWSLGVVTFELIYGETPFAPDEDDGEDPLPEVIFCNILEGIEAIQCPFMDMVTSSFSGEEAWDFVRSLLRHSPATRLGIGGASQVAAHAFMRRLDVAALEKMEVQPPDLRLGTPDFAIERSPSAEGNELPPFVEYEDDGTAWDADF